MRKSICRVLVLNLSMKKMEFPCTFFVFLKGNDYFILCSGVCSHHFMKYSCPEKSFQLATDCYNSYAVNCVFKMAAPNGRVHVGAQECIQAGVTSFAVYCGMLSLTLVFIKQQRYRA